MRSGCGGAVPRQAHNLEAPCESDIRHQFKTTITRSIVTEKLKPTFRYLVTYAESSGQNVVGVNACYMQEEGSLMLFKDASHATVFAVGVGLVICVVREGVLGDA